MRPGEECPQTQGDKHWTHRTPERLTWRGERNHAAKLTPSAVRIIRMAPDVIPNWHLARIFDVHRNTIGKARRRETWRHLP